MAVLICETPDGETSHRTMPRSSYSSCSTDHDWISSLSTIPALWATQLDSRGILPIFFQCRLATAFFIPPQVQFPEQTFLTKYLLVGWPILFCSMQRLELEALSTQVLNLMCRAHFDEMAAVRRNGGDLKVRLVMDRSLRQCSLAQFYKIGTRDRRFSNKSSERLRNIEGPLGISVKNFGFEDFDGKRLGR